MKEVIDVITAAVVIKSFVTVIRRKSGNYCVVSEKEKKVTLNSPERNKDKSDIECLKIREAIIQDRRRYRFRTNAINKTRTVLGSNCKNEGIGKYSV